MVSSSVVSVVFRASQHPHALPIVLEGHGVANLGVGAAVHDPRQQGQEDRETHADQAQQFDAVPRLRLTEMATG